MIVKSLQRFVFSSTPDAVFGIELKKIWTKVENWSEHKVLARDFFSDATVGIFVLLSI